MLKKLSLYKTLVSGLKLLNKQINNGINNINGNFVFKLYDTYGFPKELTSGILSKYHITYNEDEFNSVIEEQ